MYKPNGISLLSVSLGSAGATLGPITLPSAGTYTVLIAPIETINTIAGIGLGDGSIPTLAKLVSPGGTAIDSQGNIFIADSGNNLIRKIDTNAIISTVAGNRLLGNTGGGGQQLLPRLAIQKALLWTDQETFTFLYSPIGVLRDSSGNTIITDGSNNRIRKVNSAPGLDLNIVFA